MKTFIFIIFLLISSCSCEYSMVGECGRACSLSKQKMKSYSSPTVTEPMKCECE